MTDNDIVKALECCTIKGGCVDCPLYVPYQPVSCVKSVFVNTLDIIKRQKAEIESLEAEIDKQYEQAKADILGNMADGGTSCQWCIDQHRAKAIKEFAERLKAEATLQHGGVTVVYGSCIDNLVKEMTEETV